MSSSQILQYKTGDRRWLKLSGESRLLIPPRNAMNFITWNWSRGKIANSLLRGSQPPQPSCTWASLHWFICRLGAQWKSLSKVFTLQKIHKSFSLLLSFKGWVFFVTTFRFSKLFSTRNCFVWRNFSIVWFEQHFLKKRECCSSLLSCRSLAENWDIFMYLFGWKK